MNHWIGLRENLQETIVFLPVIPSGNHTKNYGTSPFYSWVNELFLWPFSIAMLNYERVYIYINIAKTKTRFGWG